MAAEAAAIFSIVPPRGKGRRDAASTQDPLKEYFWQVFITLLFMLNDQESCNIVTEPHLVAWKPEN